MLRTYLKPSFYILAVLWAIGFAFLVGEGTQEQNDRIKIEATQKANRTIDTQHRPERGETLTQTPGSPHAENGSNQSPERTFLGIKPGEALLALITVLLWLATRDLVDASKSTAERQLRAYIGLIGHDMHWDRHEFVIVIRNDGQTPARQVRSFFNQQWYTSGHDLPADFAFPDYPQPTGGSNSVFITPGQQHPWAFELDWTRFQQIPFRTDCSILFVRPI
jgi:hypothetical protein